ncbi:hypothetical protein C7974DRAFT_450972 [Boeremia exigua]|uniref:uncharacterized protein n=1 Tax=Boeremia exigua TaxID=749465 RepID=UPI001E8DD949|nr:uncharacterized protein C7974DRAFT_450972 [Boeremia exigua]KAH6637844.1 hypothetical protein C7974DRAFT_450972 [Boeremia exigua]
MIPLFATFSSPDTACLPENSFRLHPDTYNGLSSSGFFQITLSSGKLTFAQAKAIDILWDVGVGRGGQLLLAIISWREFARYLTICMETEPITFQVFRTIFLEKDASIFSAVRVSKSLVWQRRLRSKVAMTFIIVTMLFIVALPTLVSAMSGYDANVASRILDRDDNLIPFNNFSRVLYVIHDGWRIGKDGNSWITDIPSQGMCIPRSRIRELAMVIDDDVEAYGLDGKYNGISQFENRTISPPALNISAYEHDSQSFWGYNVSGLLNTTWVRGNETFDYAYIEANGKCQNIGVGCLQAYDYRWGFSFWQLFICIMLLLAWTVGIYIMWIYTHNTMALRNRHTEDVAGEYRAVLELAAAMQADLDIEDTDLSVLREKQLKERIDKEARGGAIAYAYSSSLPNTHGIRKGLAVWFKIEEVVVPGHLYRLLDRVAVPVGPSRHALRNLSLIVDLGDFPWPSVGFLHRYK